MFKRIFVNSILCPAAIVALYGVFTGEEARTQYTMLCLFVGLIACNINWCRNHLWRNNKKTAKQAADDYVRANTHGNLDDVESHKIGSSLKRGTDLRK